MADRAKKISELTALTNASGDDLLVIVDDPSGSPATKKIALSNLFANVVSNTIFKGTVGISNTLTTTTLTVSNTSTFTNTVNVSNTINLSGNVNLTQSLTVPGLYFANLLNTPASSGATGIKGEIRADSSYVYVCVANNVWKRAALSTW